MNSKLTNFGLFFVLALITLSLNPAFSMPMDENLALNVGQTKLSEMDKDSEFNIMSSTKIFSVSDKNLLGYGLNLSPRGYIVIAADSDLPPIIAYSFTNDFGDTQSPKNPLLQLIRTDLTLRMQNIPNLPQEIITQRNQDWNTYISGNRSEREFYQWPPENSTPTGGWLETNWTQNAPYNNFCPMDPVTGARSVAGCPSIAMAQILNYLQSTNTTYFDDNDDYYHSYAGRNYWIDDDYEEQDFPSFPELNDYLDSLNYHYENELPITTNDKAALVFACGAAANQVYTSQISGTFGVSQAYDAFQKFNFDQCDLLYESDPNVYQRMAMNILDSLTIHYASVNPEWTSGHNFVVDGYNTDDYFHINFGWGGYYNGWYLLPDEIPYGLTVLEGVIVDIALNPLTDENDDPETATLLQPPVEDEVYKINPAGDEDWYKFYAVAGETLDMHSEIFGNFELNSKFWLYGPHAEDGSDVVPTEYIVCDDDGYEDYQPWIIWEVQESGYYFLRVAHSSNAPGESGQRDDTIGAYFLNFESTPSKIEVDNLLNAPEKPELSQNYPNPFNPTTTIRFQLPKSCKVRLSIYDISGKLVKTLVDSPKEDGYHSVIWDGKDKTDRNVPSGLYLYRIEIEGFSWTKRMILLK